MGLADGLSSREHQPTEWDSFFLGMAEYVSRKSKDPSTKVGAVIVRPDNTVASVGYNGLPRGVADTPERLQNREIKYEIIVHAEENALLFAREPVHGYTIYVWPFHPCSRCAGKLIQAGISRVITVDSDTDRWNASFSLATHILREAGVEVVVLPREAT
jgi:dCMP deaminase